MAKKTTKINGLSSVESLTKGDVVVDPTLKVYFGYCLYKSALRLRYLLDQALEPHGMIAPHLGILRMLNSTGSMSQVDLADALTIDCASMVKLVDGLEKMKVVERRSSPDDRRVNLISMTLEGRKMFEKTTSVRKGVEADFLSPLDDHEREVVLKAIPKLLR